jgi:predicted Zn-dependent protease
MTIEETARVWTVAQHYIEIGQPQRAIEALGSSGSVDLEDSTYWFLRGQAQYDLDRYAEAAEAARNGLAREAESVPLLYLLGNSEARLGNLSAAEQALLTALRLQPEDPGLLCRYALLVAQAGQLDKAERLMQEAARIDPDHFGVLHARMLISFLRGDDKRALSEGQDVLTKYPESQYGHYMLGQVMLEQRQIGQAGRHLRNAARLDPSDADIVESAREARFYTHWTLWPLHQAHRIGRIRLWLIAVALIIGLPAIGLPEVAAVFMIAYFAFVVYSWTYPPLLKRWLRRRSI